MALDERFLISPALNQFFIDKDTGLPLANGTLEFYKDSDHLTPKPVYQISGSFNNYSYTPMGAVITLSSVGTIQDSSNNNELMYFFPYDGEPTNTSNTLELYYVVCKNSDGVEQWTRDAIPNLNAGNNPTETSYNSENELSNCQFSRILINQSGSTIYTVAGDTRKVFKFAPDWDFVVSGSGNVTVSRIAISGDDDIVTNPSYALQVDVGSSITECFLRQRFPKNSGLFASTATGNKFLSGTFVAKNQGAGEINVSMYYDESAGLATPTRIVSGAVTTAYKQFPGSVQIAESNNTQSGADAYVDIYLSFAASTTSRVTSIQVVPTSSALTTDYVPFDVISANRDQARMGDYFIPALEYKPIPSLLTGWDFPLNPAQENGGTATVTTTAAYVWDQTISASATANVALVKSGETSGMEFTNTGATDAFYVMQYLSGAQAKKLIATELSVNVNAYKGTVGTSCTCRVYLYRAPAASAIPLLSVSGLGTVATTGVFSLNAAQITDNWTEIPRGNMPTASADLKSVPSTNYAEMIDGIDYGFSGWEITDKDEISDTDHFAIVVTFQVPTISTVVTVNSISLVSGKIPTRPAPQTPEQVLQECQHYYSKSFAVGVAPAQNAGLANAVFGVQVATGAVIGRAGPIPRFPVEMRAIPTVTVYNPSAANAQILNVSTSVDWSATAIANQSTGGFSLTGTTNAGSVLGDTCAIHWMANAQLGIIA